MTTDAEAIYRPVGLLDDDLLKKNAQVRSARVLGTLADLPEVVEATGAEVLVVAIARADSELMRRVHDITLGLGTEGESDASAERDHGGQVTSERHA